jgi:uncharacterized protein (TIGR02145 family)
MKFYLLIALVSMCSFSQAQITDIDGNSYDTVRIGTQTWMSENLNVSRFRNGDPIALAKTNKEWQKAGKKKKPAWCYYNNDGANDEKYGKLYNWYAVNDPRGLAPVDYRIPSLEEWGALTDHLGGDSTAGIAMKSNHGWMEMGNGTNESGFGALPGGRCDHSGTCIHSGKYGFWWTNTQDGESDAWGVKLFSTTKDVVRGDYSKEYGFSVRCIKD